LNKSLKTVQFNNQLLAKENKTLLAFEPLQALGGTTSIPILLLGFILFMNRKNKPNLLFSDGNIRIVLFFVCWFYSSHHELAYNYILLFNPALLYFFIFGLQRIRNGSTLFNLLSLVVYLFMMMNKAHLLIVSPLIITSGIVLVKIALKKEAPIII
jgi:hypothetical protein